ncbi:MAG: DVUA0089 family protein, partial [Planctomycetota bacterium]
MIAAQDAFFSIQGETSNPGESVFVDLELSDEVSSADTFRLQTFHHGGGVNAAGQAIASGSFDPFVELFDSANASRGANDDGNSTVNFDSLLSWPGVAISPQSADVPLNPVPLSAGRYQAQMRALNNFSTGDYAFDLVGPADRFQLKDIAGQVET